MYICVCVYEYDIGQGCTNPGRLNLCRCALYMWVFTIEFPAWHHSGGVPSISRWLVDIWKMYGGPNGARWYAGKAWNHNALVSKCRRCVDSCQYKRVYRVVGEVDRLCCVKQVFIVTCGTTQLYRSYVLIFVEQYSMFRLSASAIFR